MGLTSTQRPVGSNAPKRSLLRNSLAVTGTKLVVLSLAVLSIIIQARALGPEGRGLLAALIVLPQMLIPFAEFGAKHTLTLFIGKRTFDSARLYGSVLLTLSCTVSLACAGTVWMLYHSPQNFGALMITIAVLIIPIGVFTNALKGTFLGHERVAEFNQIFIVQKVVMVGLLLTLWIAGALTVTTAVICLVMGSMVALASGVRQISHPRFKKWTVDYGVTKQVLGKGLIIATTMFLLEVLYKADLLLLSWLGTSTDTGLFAAAVQMGSILWEFPIALGMVVLAKSANAGSQDPTWISSTATAVRIAFWGMIMLGTVTAVLAPWLVPFFLGEDFSSSVVLLQLLIPGIVLMTVFQLLNMGLAGRGLVYLPFLVILPCATIKLLLSVWVIPRYGAQGAAFLSSVVYALAAFGMAFVYCRCLGSKATALFFIQKADIAFLKELASRKTGKGSAS